MHTEKKYDLGKDKGTFEKLLEQQTAKEIAGIYGCSQGLVCYYAKKFGIVNTWRKYNYPDLSPSPELRYLIGVVVGDGSITKIGSDYAIRLSAKDEEFVVKFAKTLAIVNRRDSCYPIWRNKRGLLVTTGRSKELYYFIKNVEYYEVIQTYPHEFIEGFFDSEGSVSKTKKWNSWHITLSNTKLNLIELTQWMLDNIGIEARIYLDKKKGQKVAKTKWSNDKDYYKNFDVYKLQVLAKDNHTFARAIHPAIVRKKARLQTILETTKEWKEEVTCP
ncbi:unnamed protein product, partial [marine sediment metagenome]